MVEEREEVLEVLRRLLVLVMEVKKEAEVEVEQMLALAALSLQVKEFLTIREVDHQN